MIGLIIIIFIIVYAGKYYRWTERLGYFKSMGITVLIIFSIVALLWWRGIYERKINKKLYTFKILWYYKLQIKALLS